MSMEMLKLIISACRRTIRFVGIETGKKSVDYENQIVVSIIIE